jgi:DNA-binding CsgD family transcriptional regulator
MERNSKGQFVTGKTPLKVDEKYIVDNYKDGKSLSQIAKALNISNNTVMRRLKKLNIPRREAGFKKGHIQHPGSKKHWFKKGQRSAAWKTGIRYTSGGYREVWVPKKQKYVREHRYIMELHLGRPLQDDEHIHHINKNILDNRIENLQIMSPEEHGRHHGKENYENKTSMLYKINNS